MKTLHVVDSLDPRMGGTARAPLDICAGLRERGEHVLLVATTTSKEQELNALPMNSAHPPYQLFTRRFPKHNFRSPALRRWLRANVASYDLVEIHGIFSFVPLYAAWACRRSSVPYTLRPHGSLDPYDLQNHAAAKQLLGPVLFRPLLRGAAAVILTSEKEADRVITFGAEANKIVMPLPVLPPAHAGDGASFRAIHGIPEDAVVVLLLGRIHPKKGLQFLIPSLAAIKPEFPRLWFLVVGTGEAPHLAQLDDLLAAHQMAMWTTRCDFLSGSSKQSAFAASDIFALPSLNENFGIAVVEAMYAGVPVLISDEVYIHDVVASGNAGVVCEPTLASCRHSLREVISDTRYRQEMAKVGPELAWRRFGPDSTIAILVDAYEELVERHAGPARDGP